MTCEYCQLLYLLTAKSSGPEISRWAEDLDGTISIDPGVDAIKYMVEA